MAELDELDQDVAIGQMGGGPMPNYIANNNPQPAAAQPIA